MRKLILTLTSIGFILTGCASTVEQSINKQPQPLAKKNTTTHAKLTTENKPTTKNPLAVSFFTKGKPSLPYEIIGEESISKYHMGHKRQEAYIRDGMRELAAAMGGDAIINIKHDASTITGTVVAFKNQQPEVG